MTKGTAKLSLDEFGVPEQILERLNEDYGCIAAAMDFSAMESDSRASLDNVQFTNVTLGSGDSITIEYEYDWSLYRGCSDMNEADTVEAHISGTYKDGSFEFPIIPSTTDRSTYDEF
jgi:hypothetical protein